MPSNEPICPRCQGDLTQAIKEGTSFCHQCGAGISENLLPPPVSGGRISPRFLPLQKVFWILLLAPCFLSLVSFSLGEISEKFRDSAGTVGFIGLIVGAPASIFCGVWLACRLWKDGVARYLGSVVLVVIMAVLNFIIIFAGCARNVRW